MVIKIQVKLGKTPQALDPNFVTSVINREITRGVAESLVITRNEMVKESPTGIGILKNSWVTDGPNVLGKTVVGRVSSSEVQALVIDEGAKPHFPPIGREPALAPWIRRKLGITDPKKVRGIALKIGKKFSRRGIPAKRTFSTAFLKVTPIIVLRIKSSVDRIVERLGKS